jgi:hypothetical protein
VELLKTPYELLKKVKSGENETVVGKQKNWGQVDRVGCGLFSLRVCEKVSRRETNWVRW